MNIEHTNQDSVPSLIPIPWVQRVIGGMGFLFPLILVVGNFYFGGCNESLLPSVSDYYHTIMHDWFVGVLCIIAVFLFAYRGYEIDVDTGNKSMLRSNKIWRNDKLWTNIASVSALGVAFFPTSKEDYLSCVQQDTYEFQHLHMISALLLFSALAYICLKLFTLCGPNENPDSAKIRKIRFYKVCGWIMILCIMAIGIFFIAFEKIMPNSSFVLYFEWLALWAFGASWVVKSGVGL
jgi:hypothetical protein